MEIKIGCVTYQVESVIDLEEDDGVVDYGLMTIFRSADLRGGRESVVLWKAILQIIQVQTSVGLDDSQANMLAYAIAGVIADNELSNLMG